MNSGGEYRGENKRQGVLEVDVDLYTHYLEDTDMSEDDKRVFLETLWSILVQFVDLGFDLHGISAVENCSSKLAKAGLDDVHSVQAEQTEETMP